MKKKKSAMVTTEVAIALALGVVVLFLAIGMFKENISQMTAHTNFTNMFQSTTDKTEVSYYNRDYTKTQINVQITGAQGLELIRRKANNKAIDIIEENFSPSNPYGASIAYLAAAINIITGQPHLCTYMKKDSDEHCDKIGGYSYKISISPVDITVASVDVSGSTVFKTVKFTLVSVVSGALRNISVPVNQSSYPTLSTDKKYEIIKNLTQLLKDNIRPDALLMNALSTFKGQSNSELKTASVAVIKPAVVNFTAALTNEVKGAYEGCTPQNGGTVRTLGEGCTGYYTISQADYNKFVLWQANLNEKLNSAQSVEEIEKLVGDSLSKDILAIVANDNYHYAKGNDKYGQGASTVLKNYLNSINSTYGTAIEVPDVKPSGRRSLEDEIVKVAEVVKDTASKAGRSIKKGVKKVLKHFGF